MREKAVVLWGGGKDAAQALYEVREKYDVTALLTMVTPDGRIGMHGVRGELLRQQAEALGLPPRTVTIPAVCSNTEYEAAFSGALEPFREAGVSSIICGDLFLEDVRRYREERLFAGQWKGVYPLWQGDTAELARRVSDAGLSGGALLRGRPRPGCVLRRPLV